MPYIPCSVLREGCLVSDLVCSRKQEIVFTGTRRIGGHQVKLAAWEESKGELSFSLSIPELGPEEYTYRCTFAQLMELYKNGDEKIEKPAIRSLGGVPMAKQDGDDGEEDVRSTIAQILHPIIDRLMAYPTVWTCAEQNWKSIE